VGNRGGVFKGVGEGRGGVQKIEGARGREGGDCMRRVVEGRRRTGLGASGCDGGGNRS